MNTPEDNKCNADHWLVRAETIRRIWIGFGLVLAGTVLAQFAIPVTGAFSVDGTLGFGAWFGFLACLAMVLVARAAGWLLKRPESYYDVHGDGEDTPRA